MDAEIYERCLLRIGVFRQALGGSEEILGRLTRELREIAENLTLSPEERTARLQQLADNEVRAIQEQARLEVEQAKLFGLELPKCDEDMIRQASSFWLATPLLANLIARYLETVGVTNLPISFGQKRIITLQIGQDIRAKLLADFVPINQTGVVAKNWERWLKDNDPYLAFTLDQSAAEEHRELAFITPTHPLARQAARALEPTVRLFCSLTVNAEGLPAGRHPFAIYRWRKLGLREDFTFQPVCANPEIASCMLDLLENARSPDAKPSALAKHDEDTLEQTLYRHWLDARAIHIEAISQVAQARLASLRTTHTARLSVLADQRDCAWVGQEFSGDAREAPRIPTEILSSFRLPALRQDRLTEHRENAPSHESVLRERSIQPNLSEEMALARAYLRSLYGNGAGHMVCQCCHGRMPFEVKDQDYFEAIQCIRGLDRHIYENRLALCPTCAARYRHARQTSDTELRSRIVSHQAPDTAASVRIPVTLAGTEWNIHFVGKHWFDLKTLVADPAADGETAASYGLPTLLPFG
ncbi:MAG: hypothetical protein NTW21_04245 [Verrucomicrobia bacterium]|nr:hypothetical protein [Verrucomicrobiota bacterium]